MKLICFSNNTAGGLLCNLLNNNLDLNNHDHFTYRVSSPEHEEFKFGDSASIQKTLDVELWNKKIHAWQQTTGWISTHAHPSIIPDLSIFDKVIAITTMSRLSKLYRWVRYYHGWFKVFDPNWIEKDDLESIDKIRCLSYNVFDPFTPHPACENVEFEDIVSGKFIQDNNLNLDYFNTWKEKNPWLFPVDENSWAIKRFNEAEYEITHQTAYKYI